MQAREEAAGRQHGASARAGRGKASAGTAGKRATTRVAEPFAAALSPARRTAWWAFVAMVFAVPLATSNLGILGLRTQATWDQFELIKVFVERLVSLLALSAWAWDLLRRGGKLRHTPVDWLVVAFLGWGVLTTATSIHWPTSLFGSDYRYEGLLSLANYALIYFLALQLCDSGARIRTLARVLFFSSLLVAAYGVAQYAGLYDVNAGESLLEPGRAASTYGNPEFLGAFLVFSMTLALALALSEEGRGWRLTCWTGFALNVVAWIVTFTRGAWIGGVLALALVAVIAWRQGARLRRADWPPLGVSVALGVGVIIRSLSQPSEVMNFAHRFSSILQFRSGSGQTRTEIWRAALTGIEKRPLLGWGPDTFRFVSSKFKTIAFVGQAGTNAIADNAHNYPLQLATGVGIPGVLLMYGVFVWAAVRSAGTVFRRSADPSRVLLGAFWAGAAGYLVQLLFGISLPGTTFLLWVALGVVLVPTARLVEVKAPRWGAAGAVVVSAVCLVVVGYHVALVAADHAYLEAHLKSGKERTAAARQAARLNRFSGAYRAEVGLACFNEAQGYVAAGSAAAQAGQDPTVYDRAILESLKSAETALKDANAFCPDEYDYYVWLAELFNFGGDMVDKRSYDTAIAIARKGIEIEPYGPALRQRLARALLSTGRIDEGIEELEYCLRMSPSYGDAALLLAQAYERTGRVDEALAVLRRAEASPGQPGVAEEIRRLEAGPAPAP